MSPVLLLGLHGHGGLDFSFRHDVDDRAGSNKSLPDSYDRRRGRQARHVYALVRRQRDVRRKKLRINSYNVCYTKLLRIDWGLDFGITQLEHGQLVRGVQGFHFELDLRNNFV